MQLPGQGPYHRLIRGPRMQHFERGRHDISELNITNELVDLVPSNSQVFSSMRQNHY